MDDETVPVAPAETSKMPTARVPPVRETLPRATETECAVCVPTTVTVYEPVPSVPAPKTTLSAKVVAAEVAALAPAGSAEKFVAAPSQFPDGLAPPEPGVAPS